MHTQFSSEAPSCAACVSIGLIYVMSKAQSAIILERDVLTGI